IYGSVATVHVSGHGSREEMRVMLPSVQQRFLLPVNGELRHLPLHARLAQQTGPKREDIFILQNGACWTTDGEKACLKTAVPAGDVNVDGYLVGEIGASVVQDRERLAQEGVVIVSLPINKRHELAAKPLIISRGFLHPDESDEIIEAAIKELQRG